jgi:uncharacterized protein YybS (DUF2232 family)
MRKGPVSVRTGGGVESRVAGPLVAGTLAALAVGSAAFVPFLAPLSLLAPLPLALQRLRAGLASALLAVALSGALVAASGAHAVAYFLLVLAVPGLLLGEALARGRGLLRGCAWAFGVLVSEVALGLVFAGQAMAERFLGPLDQLRSEAFLAELRAGGLQPERIDEYVAQMTTLRDVVAVVFPAAWIIGAAVLVAVNAAILRLYLVRRDPGWLEEGEFERIRWPLALVAAFIVSGAAVALPLARPIAYNVLLVVAFFFALQGVAVVAFYARRLAAPPLLRFAILLLVLANPWAPQILALVGLFDNWFDFRRWAEPPPEG